MPRTDIIRCRRRDSQLPVPSCQYRVRPWRFTGRSRSPTQVKAGKLATGYWQPGTDLGNQRQNLPVWYKNQQDSVVKVNWWREIRALRDWFAIAFFTGVSEETF